MDYIVTYLQVYTHFYVSYIVLLVDSNAAYLVMLKVKSRTTGYFQLLDYLKRVPYSAILVECKALKYVVISVVESKTEGVFHNAQVVLLIWYILE